jgi:hypothetical protein
MSARILCLEPEDMLPHGDKGPNTNITKSLKNIKKSYIFINVPFSLLRFGVAVPNDDET